MPSRTQWPGLYARHDASRYIQESVLAHRLDPFGLGILRIPDDVEHQIGSVLLGFRVTGRYSEIAEILRAVFAHELNKGLHASLPAEK